MDIESVMVLSRLKTFLILQYIQISSLYLLLSPLYMVFKRTREQKVLKKVLLSHMQALFSRVTEKRWRLSNRANACLKHQIPLIVQSARRVAVTLNYNSVSCLFYAQWLIFNIAQKHAYVAGVIWTLPPDSFRMVLSSAVIHTTHISWAMPHW